jgi:hypothetical protein
MLGRYPLPRGPPCIDDPSPSWPRAAWSPVRMQERQRPLPPFPRPTHGRRRRSTTSSSFCNKSTATAGSFAIVEAAGSIRGCTTRGHGCSATTRWSAVAARAIPGVPVASSALSGLVDTVAMRVSTSATSTTNRAITSGSGGSPTGVGTGRRAASGRSQARKVDQCGSKDAGPFYPDSVTTRRAITSLSSSHAVVAAFPARAEPTFTSTASFQRSKLSSTASKFHW